MLKKNWIILGSSGFIASHSINYIQLNKLGKVLLFDIKNNIGEDVRD